MNFEGATVLVIEDEQPMRRFLRALVSGHGLRVGLRHASLRAGAPESTVFTLGPLRVDLAERRVLVRGAEVHLTPLEYRLLTTLVRHAGRVLTHRQILQDLPLGVCATDNQGKIVLWNLALEVMTGVEAAPLIGTRLNKLPRPWDGLLGGFARTNEDHIYRMELPVAGKPRWYNLHKAAYADPMIEGAGPSRPGMVMLIEDLTDLGNLEAELAHNDRLASVGRLAAGVAHEIGNPVTGIASLAQNLRHEEDPEVMRQSIEDIIEQTRRISDILGTLKSFSRGSRHLQQRETFALHEAIDQAVHLLELTHKHDGIRFEASCPSDIVLTGNRQQLSQVLVNLMGNAADASKPGDRVDLLARASADEAVIEVMDQGQGIPDELRETVFEPFYTTKPTGQGTGLGLSLAYKIIEDHNGTLTIDSQAGFGTRVVVTLPLRETEQPYAPLAHH